MAYIETPRTDAGNATLMTNGHNLENFSVENSLLSPMKRKDTRDDLLSRMRNGGGSLKTPRARIPLGDRRNLPSVPARQEFTPLLQSVTKKNFERKGRLSGQPETPAFLKGSLQHSDSPALPGVEASAVYGSELGSSVIGGSNGTPMPQVVSSSAQSTPLAVLPKRDAAGVLTDQGNLMTLREQENIINKIEKENFGLKLKIHFLEESLRKSGPGFNEAALKENTDLKVDRITLQKELSRCKKMLSQAERDVEALRRHVEEVQEKSKHKQADERLQTELKILKESLVEKETEVEEMRIQVESTERHSDEIEKLKAEIEDLEMDLREKDRLIDERDDEVDNAKVQAKKDAEDLDGAEAELEEAKKRIEELENDEGRIAEAAERLEEVQAELREALEARERAEADSEELREEMSNKSFTTKGLNRQLEEKSNRLQDDLNKLRENHAQLQDNFDDKDREAKRLGEELHDREQDADVRDQRLKDQNELIRNENESMARKCDTLNDQIQRAVNDLQRKSEEKDLLYSRHDALTVESHQLQKDLSKAYSLLEELEQNLKDEKRHAEDNDRRLRSEAKEEMNRLIRESDDLRIELREQESQSTTNKDLWESQRRSLESKKEKAEEQAAGLQRTISKIHETEGALSGRENQLQEALNSENQRHKSEEAILQRRIEDLDVEVEEKRRALDDFRSDLSDAKEDLRISQRDQADLEEKVQALEDEIEILQSSLDEDIEEAKREAEDKAESLRSQLAAAKEEINHYQASGKDKQLEELESRLRSAERDLSNVQDEKQLLQDRLTANNQDLHRLQSTVAEIEAERDELQSQLKQMQGQVDETFKLDQEKIELRSQKFKLENEADRLRKEKKNLTEKNDSLERNLEDEKDRAGAEESRLTDQIAELQRKLSSISQREATQKDLIQDLKQKVSRLERQLYEAEKVHLSVNSPKPSVDSPGRKSEIIEIRSQLSDAQQQLRDVRTKSRDDIRALQHRLAASDQQNQETLAIREQLEADLSRVQHEEASLQTANATSTATITRLRTRISSLETEIRTQRRNTLADDTIAQERKDLHGLLKDSKLQAEDLRLQVASRETSIAAAATREKDLRAQLKRVRDERSLQTQRSSALAGELDNLQMRYERAVENLSRQQRIWEDERKAMASKVRFPNTSISESHACEKELERRHMGELKGLAKQIQWLRARLQREGSFRENLVFEKKWLLMRIGMFEACNVTDLQLLSEMGVNPQTDPKLSTRLRLGDALRDNVGSLGEKKKPSLKVVAFAVIAGVRMERMASDWAKQRKTKEALGKKLEGMGRRRRTSYVS